ncbi:MAG: cellulase family glycosylhydrolase [Myxococcota bacterium]
MRVPVVIVLTLWSLAGCAPTPEQPKSWRVEGGAIKDPEGRTVLLRGANVSSRHKTPPFFDFHGPADWKQMHEDWGMNAVRFLVSWAAIEPERDRFDEVYLAEVARRVREASDAGLVVIVDLHQDLYGLGFPGGNGAPAWTCDAGHYAAYTPTSPWFLNYLDPEVIACVDGFWSSRELQSHAVEAWRRLAVALRDIDGFVGVDPLNEPYWGSTQYDAFEVHRLAPFYRQVIAAVREAKPELLAFLEPASSRNLGLPTHLPSFTEGNLVYAPHAYDADAEAGMGFDASRRAAIVENLRLLREEADARGMALVLGEYGGMAQHAGIGEYMDAVYAGAAQAMAGALYWHFSRDDGYGLLAADGSEKSALRDAVVRPYPERVAGTLESFSFDGTSRTLEVVFSQDASVTAPTVLRVPVSTYPAGFTVACDGCTAAPAPGRVEVQATAARVTVTLRPR